MTAATSKQTLMAAFGFDDDDLAANRAGRMTDWQKQQLAQHYASLKRKGMGCLGVLVALGGFYIVLGLNNNNRVPNPRGAFRATADVNWFAVVLVIVVIAALAFMVFISRRAARDVSAGVVEATEGKLSLMVVNAASDTYSAKINGKPFSIERAAYDALVALTLSEGTDAVYRAYYAPGSGRLLSVELLTGS